VRSRRELEAAAREAGLETTRTVEVRDVDGRAVPVEVPVPSGELAAELRLRGAIVGR